MLIGDFARETELVGLTVGILRADIHVAIETKNLRCEAVTTAGNLNMQQRDIESGCQDVIEFVIPICRMQAKNKFLFSGGEWNYLFHYNAVSNNESGNGITCIRQACSNAGDRIAALLDIGEACKSESEFYLLLDVVERCEGCGTGEIGKDFKVVCESFTGEELLTQFDRARITKFGSRGLAKWLIWMLKVLVYLIVFQRGVLWTCVDLIIMRGVLVADECIPTEKALLLYLCINCVFPKGNWTKQPWQFSDALIIVNRLNWSSRDVSAFLCISALSTAVLTYSSTFGNKLIRVRILQEFAGANGNETSHVTDQ
ncbi:hypothetical protein HDU76_005574, partial [Blyttiomyces sp. JEL0837]